MQLPEAGEDRNLTPEQKRVLTRELRINSFKLNPLVIFADAERESKNYAKQFAGIARDQDIAVITRELPMEISGDVGISCLSKIRRSPQMKRNSLWRY